jgi:hypothetical protein
MKPGAGNRPANQLSEDIVMRYSAAIVLSAVGIASGCDGTFNFLGPAIQGSGIAKEEARTVEAFHAIDAGNAIQATVTVTHGAKPGLTIRGDDNLVTLVESAVRDGTLILRIKENTSISPKLPLLADVVTGELDRVEASGAASVKVKGGAKTDQFTASATGAAQISVEGIESSKAVATASGASHVMLSGKAASIKVEASGASQIKAQELSVDDAEVSVSGASGVVLHAQKSVAGDVSGASQLDLHGRPAKKTVSTSGASQVTENP